MYLIKHCHTHLTSCATLFIISYTNTSYLGHKGQSDIRDTCSWPNVSLVSEVHCS